MLWFSILYKKLCKFLLNLFVLLKCFYTFAIRYDKQTAVVGWARIGISKFVRFVVVTEKFFEILLYAFFVCFCWISSNLYGRTVQKHYRIILTN